MNTRLLSLAVIAILSASAYPQETTKIECPGTRVIASAEAVTERDKVSFQLELIGGNVDRSKLEYNWTVKHGRIISGQGTPVIFVSTAGRGSDGSVTATIDVSPYRDCEWVTSESVYIRRKGERTKADAFWEWIWFNWAKVQYAELAENAGINKEIRERLDEIDPNLNLEIGPKNDKGKRDLIVGYSGKPYNSKAVSEFVARAPNSLIFGLVFKNLSIDHHP